MAHGDHDSTRSEGSRRDIASVFAASDEVMAQYLPPSLHKRTLQAIAESAARRSVRKLQLIRIGLVVLCSATWLFATVFGDVLSTTTASIGVPDALIYALLFCTALLITSAFKTHRISPPSHPRNND